MNRFFFLFILYAVLIWGGDLIRTFCDATMTQAFIFIGLVMGVLLFLWRREIVFSRDDFTKWDVFFVLLLTLIYLLHSLFPTRDWDVISYHILHFQQLPWNQVTESFFPSTILHSHLFPLADRLSYPFYHFLGFRIGTILNLFVVGVVYVQIREILMGLLKNREVPHWYCPVFAFCIMASLNVMLQMHSYYVDIRTVPILLFFMHEFINRDGVKSKNMLLFMAFCVGIEICFKMSSGVPLLVCSFYFLFASRRNVSPLFVCGGVIICLLPLLPYGYINFLETQSPLFPYMNQIFNSPFFLHNEDSNYVLGGILFFGPQNLLQALVWPVYSIVQGPSANLAHREVLLLISAMLAAFFLWRKSTGIKDLQSFKKLVILYVILYLLGACVYRGFLRYNPGLLIVASTLCCYSGIILFERKGAKKYLAVVFLVVLLLQPISLLKVELGSVVKDVYQECKNQNGNIAVLFHDHDQEYPFTRKVNSWLTIGSQPTSGYAYLLKKRVPIITLDGYAPMYVDVNGDYENPIARKLYEEHMKRYLGKGMYILLQTLDFRPTYLNDGIHQKTLMGELVQILHQRGVRLQNYEQISPNFIRVNQNITMAEAVPASSSTAFNDYLLKPNSSCKLDKSYQGDSRYTLTMALKPDDFGSVPQYSFSGHIDLYDRASGRLLSRQDFASDGEYVTIELSTVGEVEVVFDSTTAPSVQELMILAYEEDVHDE